MNIGTMLALFIFFRKKIWQIIVDIFKNRQYRLARNILLTSIPAGAVGFFFADFIGTTAFFASAVTVVFTLAIVGVLLITVEKLPKASEVKDGEHLSGSRAFIIGVAQMIALIPGVSRSGATILAGRFSGLKPADAAECNFGIITNHAWCDVKDFSDRHGLLGGERQRRDYFKHLCLCRRALGGRVPDALFGKTFISYLWLVPISTCRGAGDNSFGTIEAKEPITYNKETLWSTFNVH